MNVVCIFKWGRNPHEAAISADGTLTWRGTKLIASDDDATAIVEARELAAATGGELTGVTIGQGDPSWALARGAQRVINLPEFAPSEDEAQTARVLAAAVQQAGPCDVIVMGNALETAGVVGYLGGLLGLPVIGGVETVEVDPANPGRVLVRRQVREVVETLSVPTPVLVGVSAVAAEKSPPGMKELLAARKLPVEVVDAATITADDEAVTLVGTRLPISKNVRIFDQDAATASQSLVAALRADGVL